MDGLHAHAAGRSAGRRSLAALVILVCLLTLLAAAAGPVRALSRGDVFDPSAEPSWAEYVAGTGAGFDSGLHVLTQGASTTFMCGYLVSPAGSQELSITKYSEDVLKWTKTFDGPGSDDDRGYRMALSPDGRSVYVTGTGSYAHSVDLLLIKYDVRTGRRLWVKHWDGRGHTFDVGWRIGVDGAGNVVVGGLSIKPAETDCVIASWSPSGARRWVWTWAGAGHAEDAVYGLHVTRNGATYACGPTGAPPTGAGFVVRLNSSGRQVWFKRWTGTEGHGAAYAALAPRPGGGVYVAGETNTAATQADGLLVRYSPKGKRTVVAVDPFAGGPTDELFRDVAVTATGYVVCAGKTQDATDDNDARFIVYRPNGDISVVSTLATPSQDEWTCVAVDPFGAYCLAGQTHVAVNDERIVVLRRSTLPGGGGFASRWSPVVVTDCQANAVAMRATSVYVAGNIDPGGATGPDQVLLAFTY